MLSNTQLTLIRTGATVLITGMAAIQPLYPSYTWIAAVIAVASTVGIHAIPAISQVVVTRGSTMSEQSPEEPQTVPYVDGLAAMGLKPAEQTPVEPEKPAEEPQSDAQTPEEPPTAEAKPLAEEPPTAPVDAEKPDPKQALLDAAQALTKIAQDL